MIKLESSFQDYYALYKLYKKSGPGPKNGEQYGAPFKEEDWVDDADGQEPQVKILDEVNSVVREIENGRIQLSSDDIEELMQQVVNDPVPVLPSISGYHQFDSAVQVGCPVFRTSDNPFPSMLIFLGGLTGHRFEIKMFLI